MTSSPSAVAPASGIADWQSAAPWIRFGYRVCIYLIGGLFLWSALVSISGAVIATGTVMVESNTKTVQHLDGGIVSQISVRNGDRVKKGDVLLTLDSTATRASHAIAASRVNDLAIQEARLEAERDGRDTFVLPELADPADPSIAKLEAAQRELFAARRAARDGEISVLKERQTQTAKELDSLEAQLAARRKEREINGRELATVMPLFERGYVNQQRIGPLQREAARLDGEISRIAAELARTRAALSEAELRLKQSTKAFTETVVDELRKVKSLLAESNETLRAQADRLERTVVRAPRAGIVHALAVHTEGGVITPAGSILQIVPEDERLVVEAQVPPQEIDKVREGLPANVRFTAFSAHTTPRLEGTVARVSPALIVDRDGRSYFTAQIDIASGELAKLGRGHELRPGMPGEVHIETSSRSILSYILKPLADALSRTFREG